MCAFMSAQEIRSLVWAFVKPAWREGFVRTGEAGDSNSHCQVVMFRGTGVVTSSSQLWALKVVEWNSYDLCLAVCF